MLEAALAGAGLVYLGENSVAEHVAAGRLISVLEDWSPPYPGLCLYYPGRRHVPAGPAGVDRAYLRTECAPEMTKLRPRSLVARAQSDARNRHSFHRYGSSALYPSILKWFQALDHAVEKRAHAGGGLAAR
jgi:hypothetical protein